MDAGSDRIMAAKQETARDYYHEARLLIGNVKSASLATVEATMPYAALVTVAFLPDFTPILLLSQLATHTRHLHANPACALLLVGAYSSPNPQTAARLCLTGTAQKTETPGAREIFLASHPYATGYADFADFAFWRLIVTEAYYIGGFAAASRLDAAKLMAPG
jgi:putative heme iron utilization protein